MAAIDPNDGGAQIRSASSQDAEALVPLIAELGYPTPERELKLRLERLMVEPTAGMLIAEQGGRAIGFASFHTFELIYRPRPQARLTALAVDSGHRRLGIGRELVRAVEKAARKRGCFRIEVTTRIDSHHAQAFYSALGYQERPMRFVKRLDT